MTREEVKAQFEKDVADHKLTVMRDDGLYRPSHSGYCDDCPVRDICPFDRKQWSK